MFDFMSALNFGGQAFIGFAVFAAIVTPVGIAMLYYYVKKEAGQPEGTGLGYLDDIHYLNYHPGCPKGLGVTFGDGSGPKRFPSLINILSYNLCLSFKNSAPLIYLNTQFSVVVASRFLF